MIDMPIGKALEAVKVNNTFAPCKGCCFAGKKCVSNTLACIDGHRKDGNNVIFKLADFKK